MKLSKILLISTFFLSAFETVGYAVWEYGGSQEKGGIYKFTCPTRSQFTVTQKEQEDSRGVTKFSIELQGGFQNELPYTTYLGRMDVSEKNATKNGPDLGDSELKVSTVPGQLSIECSYASPSNSLPGYRPGFFITLLQGTLVKYVLAPNGKSLILQFKPQNEISFKRK